MIKYDEIMKKRFWFLGANQDDTKNILLDSHTKLLWQIAQNDQTKMNKTFRLSEGWHLPSFSMLIEFAKTNHPWKQGDHHRILGKKEWLYENGVLDLDNLCSMNVSHGFVIAVNKVLQGMNPLHIEQQLNAWHIKAAPEIYQTSNPPSHTNDALKYKLQHADYDSVRLPVFDESQLTDHNKGLWEAWGMDAETLKKEGIVARNPALDVKESKIAIDFGTSSTVVAVNNNGRHELLRIGVKDFYEAVKASHFENPTVLEFIDFQAFITQWQSTAYRPNTQWDHIKCSHEAQHNFRNNQTESHIVSSIFPKMKQWALRQSNDTPLKIIDQTQRHEIELAPLAPKNPVKGSKLIVSPQDDFDPIELYAWFLGMTINWRVKGIYLQYFMTFPVDYPKQVKDNILASFRRGLLRSMPETLVTQPIFQEKFTVQERASEPAAYAACALNAFNIQPTTEGVAYSVFDFGGGTTDFDYGYYRLPNAEEDDEGYEQIFEHFEAQGDKFLGGENLLENIAYRVFVHNIEQCRSQKVSFTCPLDATPFAGSEMFLDKTQTAQTNSIMLMAKLRPFWETGEYTQSSGIEQIELVNREGKKVTCEFDIPVEALNEYLTQRIEEGILKFFIGAKTAFANQMPETLYILLAGNASRSKWVSDFFAITTKSTTDTAEEPHAAKSRLKEALVQAFGKQAPQKIIVKAPLPVDDKDPYRPTAKTGVALGLLNLCPGSPIKVINRSRINTGDSDLFTFFVGRIKQGKFQPALNRGQAYGQWHELGPIREGVIELYYTQSPKALTGEMVKGETDLLLKSVQFSGNTQGHRAFVRASKANQIEIGSAESKESLALTLPDNVQTLTLV